jgi:hypothetical protein
MTDPSGTLLMNEARAEVTSVLPVALIDEGTLTVRVVTGAGNGRDVLVATGVGEGAGVADGAGVGAGVGVGVGVGAGEGDATEPSVEKVKLSDTSETPLAVREWTLKL